MMSPHLRKFALTAHIVAAVGWIGAVAAFLGIAVAGLTSQDAQTVRGAYLVMDAAAWLVLVPLAFASLLTGLVMSLVTTWGLFRHYWVIFKLVIAGFATIVLLIYMETFNYMAGVAADPTVDLDQVRNGSPMIHAILALIVLLVATVLAVYKPRGMTRYGWRRQYEQPREPRASRPVPSQRESPTMSLDVSAAVRSSRFHASYPRDAASERGTIAGTRWRLYILIGVAILVLLILVLHLFDGGIPRH